MKKIYNILISSGFIKFVGLICICMTIFATCIKVSADNLDLGDGVFQEVSPGEYLDEGTEEEYVGSQDDIKSPAEGTQEPEEATIEVYENGTQADQDSDQASDDNQESEEGTTEVYESSTQGDQDPDQEHNQESNLQDQMEIDVLKDIDNSIKKLIISLWALFGLLLGTKLIKGLFGYGG